MANVALQPQQSSIWWVFLLQGLAGIILGLMLLAEPGRTATRLAAIPGRMQHPSAQQALFPSSRDGDILIKDEKQFMECGVSQQG